MGEEGREGDEEEDEEEERQRRATGVLAVIVGSVSVEPEGRGVLVAEEALEAAGREAVADESCSPLSASRGCAPSSTEGDTSFFS